MITNDLRYGGTLNVGDFIGIGSDWGMNFGWYCGNGKAGNIQYICPRTVVYNFEGYNHRVNWSKDNNTVLTARDRKGFTLDHIGKNPIRNHKKDNAVKIIVADGLFHGTELKDYERAKEILTQIKFLKS